MAKEKKVKEKKTEKNNKKPVEKKVKKEGFFKSIKSEFKKIRWPNKKEMIKYSIATIVFILFFGVFFYLIEVMMWAINRLVG
jgi:preprotein translocase subunit SecE